MNTPHDHASHADLDGAPGAERLTALLTERARSVSTADVPVSAVIGRARRVRQRRRAVVVSGGVAVSIGAGAFALRPASQSRPDTSVIVGAPGESSTTPPPTPSTSAPDPRVVVPITTPATTAPVPRSPLRMGLALPGATVTYASDIPEADSPPSRPASATLTYESADGARSLHAFVAAPFTDPQSAPTGSTLLVPPGDTEVRLANGGEARIRVVPLPVGAGSVQLTAEVQGHAIMIIGAGLTQAEVIAVASSIEVRADGDAVAVGNIPDDLVESSEEAPSVGGGGIRNQIVYRMADGAEAVVDVYNVPDSRFTQDLEQARTRPTAELSTLPVRSTTAVVRTFAMGEQTIITVTWIEPTGHLVTVRLTPIAGHAPVDPAVVPSAITALDEAAFQALDPEHPARPGG